MYTTKVPFKESPFTPGTKYAKGLGGEYIDPGKRTLDPRWRGKQMKCGTGIQMNDGKLMKDGVFGEFSSVFIGDTYTKPTVRKETLDGFGFGSKEAAGRDGLSNVHAVLMYREKLASEKKFAAKFAEQRAKDFGGNGGGAEFKDDEEVPQKKTLYDTVFADANDNSDFQSKIKPKQHCRAMNRGAYKTTAEIIGGNVADADYNAKRFGKRNCTKDFADHGHQDPNA